MQCQISMRFCTIPTCQVPTGAEAAKAETENVRAELSRILLEPKPKNIRAESLEPRKFLL